MRSAANVSAAQCDFPAAVAPTSTTRHGSGRRTGSLTQPVYQSRAPAGRDQPGTSQSGRRLLAFCGVKSLYLRNVPDDVGRRLAALAAREGMSVSSFALRELTAIAKSADNPALLGDLPDMRISSVDVVADLQDARSER